LNVKTNDFVLFLSYKIDFIYPQSHYLSLTMDTHSNKRKRSDDGDDGTVIGESPNKRQRSNEDDIIVIDDDDDDDDDEVNNIVHVVFYTKEGEAPE